MPRRKVKYTLDELENYLEAECPGITDGIPSPSKFTFWTDNTPQQNEYVQIGDYRPNDYVEISDNGSSLAAPMRVHLGNKSGNNMFFFNIGTLHREKIIHGNKELARAKTRYFAPFDRLSVIRYEYPSSGPAESLRWFTELRALTMFAFVWCGHRAEFFDFSKGEGLKVLVEVLERLPSTTITKNKDDIHGKKGQDAREGDHSADADADSSTHTDVDSDLHAEAEEDIDMIVAESPLHEGSGQGTTTPMSLILKKHTHQEFTEG